MEDSVVSLLNKTMIEYMSIGLVILILISVVVLTYLRLKKLQNDGFRHSIDFEYMKSEVYECLQHRSLDFYNLQVFVIHSGQPSEISSDYKKEYALLSTVLKEGLRLKDLEKDDKGNYRRVGRCS